jgi:hypothetical protein
MHEGRRLQRETLLSGAVQARLVTMRAALSPAKLRNRSTWERGYQNQSSKVSDR